MLSTIGLLVWLASGPVTYEDPWDLVPAKGGSGASFASALDAGNFQYDRHMDARYFSELRARIRTSRDAALGLRWLDRMHKDHMTRTPKHKDHRRQQVASAGLAAYLQLLADQGALRMTEEQLRRVRSMKLNAQDLAFDQVRTPLEADLRLASTVDGEVWEARPWAKKWIERFGATPFRLLVLAKWAGLHTEAVGIVSANGRVEPAPKEWTVRSDPALQSSSALRAWRMAPKSPGVVGYASLYLRQARHPKWEEAWKQYKGMDDFRYRKAWLQFEHEERDRMAKLKGAWRPRTYVPPPNP